MRLNLGSWIHPKDGWVNVDIEKWEGVDVVADLNRVPWQWKTASVDEVRAIDILEHLGKLTKVEIVHELGRIVKPGGNVEIRVPNATHPIALQSIQHAHVFYLDSFEYSYAQPYFDCTRRWVSLFYGRFEFEFKRPFRPLFRFLGRLGLLYCIRFELVRR